MTRVLSRAVYLSDLRSPVVYHSCLSAWCRSLFQIYVYIAIPLFRHETRLQKLLVCESYIKSALASLYICNADACLCVASWRVPYCWLDCGCSAFFSALVYYYTFRPIFLHGFMDNYRDNNNASCQIRSTSISHENVYIHIRLLCLCSVLYIHTQKHVVRLLIIYNAVYNKRKLLTIL